MALIRFTPAGWRGRFDDDFNEESVVRLAGALGAAWTSRKAGGRVYVGYDRRYRAEAYALLAAKALSTFGLHVVVSEGYCPLPALSWQTARDPEAVGALMLTASEAPCEYCGFVARRADGGPVTAAFASEVERRVLAEPIRPAGEYERYDFVHPYLADLAAHADLAAIAGSGMRIVIDPMYGAASTYLAQILRDAGCGVHELHADAREDFGGIHPDPTEPWVDDCEQEVLRRQASIALALDGDGDRVSLINEQGRLVAAHNIAPLVLCHLAENKGYSGRVVTSLANSLRVLRQAKRLGLETTVVPVGFDRIYSELIQGDVLVGCEEFGGVAMPRHLNERDGLLVGLLLLELVAAHGVPVSQLVSEMLDAVGRSEYARRTVRIDPVAAQTLENILPGLNPVEVAGREPVAVSHSDGIRMQFDDDSWALLRLSRNGGVARTYAEAPTAKERDALLAAVGEFARHPSATTTF